MAIYTPSDEERLQAAHRYAVAQGFIHGWPSFDHGPDSLNGDEVWGTYLLPEGSSRFAFHDIPRDELGDPDYTDISGLWRACHRWSQQAGYETGMPTFEVGGQGAVFGCISITPGANLAWMDLRRDNLELQPTFANPAQCIRAVNRVAAQLHYSAGFPNFEQRDPGDGKGILMGAYMLEGQIGIGWRDVPDIVLFPNNYALVPYVIGQSLQAAELSLRIAGFVPSAVSRTNPPPFPGTVFSQSPGPGEAMKGAVVYLTYY